MKVKRSNSQIQSAREFLRYFEDKFPVQKKEEKK